MQVTIKSNYSIMGGQVCIEDTRIPVAQIIREFRSGRSISDIIYSYPSISQEMATVLHNLMLDFYKDED